MLSGWGDAVHGDGPPEMDLTAQAQAPLEAAPMGGGRASRSPPAQTAA